MDPGVIKTALDFAIEGAASGSVAFAGTELLKASKKLFERLRKTTTVKNNLADYNPEESEALSRVIAEAAEQDTKTAALLAEWLRKVEIERAQSNRPIKQSSISVGLFPTPTLLKPLR